MKQEKAFVLLLTILLSLFLLPTEAMANQSDRTLTLPEAPVPLVVEEDVVRTSEASTVEIFATEEPVQNETEIAAVDNEVGQGLEGSAAPDVVSSESNAGTDGELIEEGTDEQSATANKAVVEQVTARAVEGELDVDDAAIEQADSDASVAYIEPAEYVIHVDSAEYTIKYSDTELYLSGKNIVLENGLYNYNLFANNLGRMIYNNDLDILYQEVYGKYDLHYDIVEPDNHIMVVNGTFDNLLKASPLLRRKSDRISDDSYSYQLDLRTKEGFTFTNALGYTYDGTRYGYSINYSYDLAANKSTLIINGQSGRSLTLSQRLWYC